MRQRVTYAKRKRVSASTLDLRSAGEPKSKGEVSVAVFLFGWGFFSSQSRISGIFQLLSDWLCRATWYRVTILSVDKQASQSTLCGRLSQLGGAWYFLSEIESSNAFLLAFGIF